MCLMVAVLPSAACCSLRSAVDGGPLLFQEYPWCVVHRPSDLGIAALVQDCIHLGNSTREASLYLLD